MTLEEMIAYTLYYRYYRYYWQQQRPSCEFGQIDTINHIRIEYN